MGRKAQMACSKRWWWLGALLSKYTMPEHDIGQQERSESLGQGTPVWEGNANQGCNTLFFYSSVSCSVTSPQDSPGRRHMPGNCNWAGIALSAHVPSPWPWGKHSGYDGLPGYFSFNVIVYWKNTSLSQYFIQHRLQGFCLQADFHYSSLISRII